MAFLSEEQKQKLVEQEVSNWRFDADKESVKDGAGELIDNLAAIYEPEIERLSELVRELMAECSLLRGE